MKKSIFLFAFLGYAMLSFAMERVVDIDFTKQGVQGAKVAGRLAATVDEKGVSFLRDDSLNQGADASLLYALDTAKVGEYLVLRLDLTIGSTSPNGRTQTSGRWGIFLKDSQKNRSAAFYLSSTRYHNNRKGALVLGSKRLEIPFNFPVDEPVSLYLLLDRTGSQVGATVKSGKQTLFSTGLQACEAFLPDTIIFHTATNSYNDGMNALLTNLFLDNVDKKSLQQLSFRPGQVENNGEDYCATAPRHYRHVNTSLYNAAIISLASDNDVDRMALATPEAAQKRAEELSDLGFNAALYNGRHFRANYANEFTSIRQAARLLSTALKARGIELIEHHDPTIIYYRGYPMMLNTLDWLQRDIRTGETSFWYCPQNEEFCRYMIDYLRRYQQEVGAAGFMIDELTYGSANFCACDYCRKNYTKATGKEAPTWSNARTMDAAQRDYRRFAVTKVLELESDLLNAMQEIRPDTIMMTYCSDYGDAVSANEDLTRTAAYNCPFVGWENMIYNTRNSWVSNLRNLKMRDGYGDFYNIPVWSLNRECVTANAHYVSWMMCQAARHGIWYGMRELLATPENVAFFKTYNKWPKRMHHQYARTFTRVGMLNSTQTQKASTSREFAWYDYIGTADALLRNNLQYTTLLDGDLFYPNRLADYTVLILPSQAALSATQCDRLVKWVEQGGVAVVTGNTSRFDEYGYPLMDYRLSPALKFQWDGSVNGAATVTAPGSSHSFTIGSIDKLAQLDPKAKVLLEANVNGNSYPFVVETPCGRGRFITVAAQVGTLLYELESRNGSHYNYRENPGALDFFRWLYSVAVKDALVEFEGFPMELPAIANQLMDGPEAGTIYIQLMNFTGKNIKFGDVTTYGVRENIEFSAIKGNLIVKLKLPCDAKAVLERPFEGDVEIMGVAENGMTTFTIPGKELKSFGQLKITGAKPIRKILEPPMVSADAVKRYPPLEKPFDVEQFYKPATMQGEVIAAPESIAKGDFTVTPDGAVYLNGELLFTGEIWQTKDEVSLPLKRANLQENATTLGWKNGDSLGYLTSTTCLEGNCVAVRETTLQNPKRLEVTVGGTLLPNHYEVGGFGYAVRFPKKLLAGCKATVHHGMNRSDFPAKTYTFTGNEPDGRLFEMSQIRDMQITGRVNFSVDFTIMGPWEDSLSLVTYAFFVVDGDSYAAYIASPRFNYGSKYCNKFVVRPGETNFDLIHPTRFHNYQYNRGASQRLQFTNGKPATGMAIHPQRVLYSKEFEKASPTLWSRPVEIVDTGLGGPLFSAGAKIQGDNAITLKHQDALVLVNVALAGPSKGKAAINGKEISFDVKASEKKTIVLPARVRNGEFTLTVSGEAIVCGIVIQPLMYDQEDYLFDRTYWNTGIVPYLLPELNCDKKAWRFWSDIPYRQARF